MTILMMQLVMRKLKHQNFMIRRHIFHQLTGASNNEAGGIEILWKH